ncbi:glycosyltransferase [Collinsella sp. HCP28S3_H5]|uniref:glycosyltransferase n=1 Tax=unclassified Collinsella TaxID=2637548 RepID=UPI003F8A5603
MKEHRELLAAGEDSYAFWGRGRAGEGDRELRFATDAEVKVDALQTRLDGKAGFHSKAATKRLLERLDEINPDVVHLHNLHGYYVNIEMLFEWLAAHDCKVEWTLHDCWAFTGHCAYFTYVKCAQWKTHCAHFEECCPQLDTYPKTYSKASCAWNFDQKKRLFNLVPAERMKLITPSQWLANLVRESFLSKYPVEVRHNTIDTSVFKPTPSDFRERYGISDRFMILGVASPWTERKGLVDFVRLAGELDSERYAIVLVGLSWKQIKQLSKRLVALPKTESAEKLAEAYSAADVFVHPGVEETFGMTVAESQACGTPVVVTEDSACAEIADPAAAYVVPADLSTLRATVVNLAGGGRVLLMTRTDCAQQLATIYTVADVFFNPTVEDNYPTVNLEAEACGTPVVTYDTGGCAETVRRGDSRVVQGFDVASSQIQHLRRVNS